MSPASTDERSANDRPVATGSALGLREIVNSAFRAAALSRRKPVHAFKRQVGRFAFLSRARRSWLQRVAVDARAGDLDSAVSTLKYQYAKCRYWQKHKLLNYLATDNDLLHRTLCLVLVERWLDSALSDMDRVRVQAAYVIILRKSRRYANAIMAADAIVRADARHVTLEPQQRDKVEAAAIYSLSRLGEHAAAVARLERELGNRPDSPELLEVGIYLLLIRNPERSVDLAHRHRSRTFSRTTFVHVMTALERLERFDELEAHLAQATTVPPRRREAWLFRANLAQRVGDWSAHAAYADRFFKRWSLDISEVWRRADVVETASEAPATPTLTVVMTTFNSAAHLESSIQSLLAQTFTDFELIVVDDASTDDGATSRTIEAWRERDARIRVIRQKTNGGTYRAKNAALPLARGRYITCHDSDDWAFPDRFEREVSTLERRPKLKAVQSAWVRMTETGRFVPMRWGAFIHENPASLMFRREVVEAIGPFDGAKTGADTEFRERLRLFYGPAAYAYLNTPLTIGNCRTGSLTTSGAAALDEELVSPARVAYWAAWSKWHADCAHRGVINTELPFRGTRLPPFSESAFG